MKLIIGLAVFALTLSAHANTIKYTCNFDQARQPGSKIDVAQGQFEITETKEGDLRSIKVDGKLYLQYDFNLEDKKNLDEYYGGTFTIEKIVENANYRPRKYKGYSQFKPFKATKTTDVDGGGMWGQFVIEKNTDAPEFKAHYIFQAGDHIGGTVDFTCKK